MESLSPSSLAPEHQWYDEQFAEAQLEFERDHGWLEALANRPLDEDAIEAANRYIASGSINLHYETDPETIQGVLQAREQFFGEFLGWQDETHPLNIAYQNFEELQVTRMPLATVIGTQRVLNELGVDVSKMINTLPTTLNYAPDSVRAKVTNLTELGLDAARVINASPTTLGLAPDSVRAKVTNLTELGLDAARVINTLPTALSYAPDSVRTRLYALMKAGLMSDERPFPVDNESFVKAFFILPTESLLLYLADQDDPSQTDLSKLPARARRYTKTLDANTSAERKALYEQRLPAVQQKLGYIAVMNAMRLGIE